MLIQRPQPPPGGVTGRIAHRHNQIACATSPTGEVHGTAISQTRIRAKTASSVYLNSHRMVPIQGPSHDRAIRVNHAVEQSVPSAVSLGALWVSLSFLNCFSIRSERLKNHWVIFPKFTIDYYFDDHPIDDHVSTRLDLNVKALEE